MVSIGASGNGKPLKEHLLSRFDCDAWLSCDIGRACSQAAAQKWKFCDTSVPLVERVNDLVDRITVLEAGSVLLSAIHHHVLP
jgi:hypothetical protein